MYGDDDISTRSFVVLMTIGVVLVVVMIVTMLTLPS